MAREKGTGSLQREKSGRWTVRVGVNGKRLSRSARTTDRDKAERFLGRMLAPLGLGERTLPLAEAWREYEKSPRRKEQTEATLNAKRVVWMRFAEWIEDNHAEISQVKHLSEEAVQEYLRVFRIGHCASTYNNHVCVLREICHCVADRAGVERDPWAHVRLLADGGHVRRAFTAAELRRIVAAADGAGGEWPLLVRVGIYTGLRLGDCCRLAWEEVDRARGVIQLVPRKTRKFGKMVTIPLHPALKSALDAAAPAAGLPPTGPVMPGLSAWYLAEHWRIDVGLKGLFAAAGIRTSVAIEGRRQATPDATFHSFRHTFVSFAVHAGVPLPVVASIVGHASSAMTRHYYHENEQSLRHAVEAMPALGAGEAKRPMGAAAASAACAAPDAFGAPSAVAAPDAFGSTGAFGAPDASRLAERSRPLSPAQRLKRLDAYFAKGIVTEDEYRAQRAAIVAAM